MAKHTLSSPPGSSRVRTGRRPGGADQGRTGRPLGLPGRVLEGRAPAAGEGEIALSDDQRQRDLGLDGREMSSRWIVEGRDRTFTVSGIYSDVTNGGKTAKAVLPGRFRRTSMWSVICVNLADRARTWTEKVRGILGPVRVREGVGHRLLRRPDLRPDHQRPSGRPLRRHRPPWRWRLPCC
ncbi:MAG: hypothetical protein MZU91_06575 [Desulfosudis oleivorans]|nr:hypothetical protein [Desulfosudis oleivorans]